MSDKKLNASISALKTMLENPNVYGHYITPNAAGNGFIINDLQALLNSELPPGISTTKPESFKRTLKDYHFTQRGNEWFHPCLNVSNAVTWSQLKNKRSSKE